ncbi:NAD(P)-binding protein [Thozetella sp. PMI_491]|nr:NAD(P)-binding protein [Thozetella sp. PMI_491]
MSKGTVFLTGASGFVGSQVAAQLLKEGYSVKASFRTEAKGQAFKNAFPAQSIQTHVVPDITIDGAYDGIIDGADYVIHCASPFTFTIKDIQKDLIDPAVKGTDTLLRAVASCPTVKRIVITSSFAAVIDPIKGPRAGYQYTENDWNPMTPERALESNLFGYQASKTFAERAAWSFVAGKPGLTLVTICPPMIFGPAHPASGITAAHPNESSRQLLDAANSSEPGPARMPVFVDVRDVAKVHVAALDTQRLPASERFVVCAGKFTWKAVNEIHKQGLCSPESLAPASEYYSIGTEKVEKMLGIKWTSLEQSVKDSLEVLGIEENKLIRNKF